MAGGNGGRVAAAARALGAAGINALLLTPGPDLQYLTGLGDLHAGERLAAFVLTAAGKAAWICPLMNRPQVAEVAGSSPIRTWRDEEWYETALRETLGELGIETGCLAVDEEMRSRFLLDVQQARPGGSHVGAGRIMRPLRIGKGADELASLRWAGAAVDAVIAAACAACTAGRKETGVSDKIREAISEREPEFRPAFCIVASGPNGALPHHSTGSRSLGQGDVVVMDYGGHLDGYVADITVTVGIGEPHDDGVREVYGVVWEAQQRALEAIRPGATCGAIDQAARSTIEAAGYGAYFTHRTGHGVGLQVHEPPYLFAGNPECLEEGMCFSVEPGIYLPGRFGVRLEVLAAVAADGVELLNRPSARELPLAG